MTRRPLLVALGWLAAAGLAVLVGARADAEGEFRGTSDGHDRVKVRVTRAGDRPDLTTRNG